MASVVSRSLLPFCQRRFVRTLTPLWKCSYSTDKDTDQQIFRKTADKDIYQSRFRKSVGPRYIRKTTPEHTWLEEFKTDLIDPDKTIDLSESKLVDLEKRFQAASKGYLANFDIVVMTALFNKNRAKEGFQFMKYIRKRRTPSIHLILVYMLCCHVQYPKAILEEYKAFKKSVDLSTCNLNTLNSLVKVAGRMSEWRDAYEMFELLQKEVEMGENKDVLHNSIAGYLCSGISASNYELILEMMYRYPEWFKQGLQRGLITPALYLAWKRGTMHMDLFFELLKDMGDNLNLRDGQVADIQSFCQRELADKVDCNLAEVNTESGVCNSCSQKLSERELSTAEFNLLKDAVLNELVVGNNIFETTTPAEINEFLHSLENQTYDVIMDGPNVFFGRDQFIWQNLEVMMAQLSKYLHKRRPKILIISDCHRTKSFYKVPSSFQNQVEMFQVNRRLSNDDVFMLVAAFKGSLATHIVTNDNLRNHRARMTDPCDKLFSVWQKRYQIMHDYRNLEFPIAFDCKTHVSPEGWHVPYEDDTKVMRTHTAYFKDTHKFVCVRKKREFSSAQLKAYLRMKHKFEEEQKACRGVC